MLVDLSGLLKMILTFEIRHYSCLPLPLSNFDKYSATITLTKKYHIYFVRKGAFTNDVIILGGLEKMTKDDGEGVLG